MMAKRARGRPVKGDAQVGKHRILSEFIVALRNGALHDFSRMEIATAIGITPALLTYYFNKGDGFMVEAVAPVIDGYVSGLASILDSATLSFDDRLLRAIDLLLTMHGRDEHVLRFHLDRRRRGGTAPSAMEAMKEGLAGFFESWPGLIAPTPHTLSGIVWGACAHRANVSEQTARDVRRMIHRLLDFDLVVDGEDASMKTDERRRVGIERPMAEAASR